jgi:putative hydrolase of the HAD superfamily
VDGGRNIEAVIFDLGRVIVDVDVHRPAGFVFSQMSQADVERLIMAVMGDELMMRFNTGRVGTQEFYDGLTERFGLAPGFEEFKDLWCGVFSPIAGMEELIRQLNGAYRLGLLSDTDPLHWAYLHSKYPVLNLFERPTLSFEVGAVKPDPAIFLAAAKNVDTPVERCLYIDDLAANVQGAVAVGMTGIVFGGAGALREELVERGML